jgi:hypothetical protein
MPSESGNQRFSPPAMEAQIESILVTAKLWRGLPAGQLVPRRTTQKL